MNFCPEVLTKPVAEDEELVEVVLAFEVVLLVVVVEGFDVAVTETVPGRHWE